MFRWKFEETFFSKERDTACANLIVGASISFIPRLYDIGSLKSKISETNGLTSVNVRPGRILSEHDAYKSCSCIFRCTAIEEIAIDA